MSIINSIASWWMRKRMHQIELFMKYPNEVQQEWLVRLMETSKDTEWGKAHGYGELRTWEEFSQRVPLQDYETLKNFY